MLTKYIPYSKEEIQYRLAEVTQELMDLVTELAFLRQQELRAEVEALNSPAESVAEKNRLAKCMAAEPRCAVLELEAKKEALIYEQHFLELLNG
jgi:hypothetical protein